ncbi:hypothetical protein EGJ18_18450 [Stutzerimonas stutzeri]|nr:hypothetical protein EGJ18_18450 [Stutzerimonas stutzeri]
MEPNWKPPAPVSLWSGRGARCGFSKSATVS